MKSSSQALAALQALFEPLGSYEVDAPELPQDLDESINADACFSWDFVSYRWYRGVDALGVTRIFRFQRGLALGQWHQLLRTQRLAQVEGPFRTQVHAQSKPGAVA